MTARQREAWQARSGFFHVIDMILVFSVANGIPRQVAREFEQ